MLPEPRRSSSVGWSSGIRRTPRQLTREQHEERFRALRASQGIGFSARGCATSYAAYAAALRHARGAKVSEFTTTNSQRAVAMANRGRARCPRTVQRHHRLLAELGLAQTLWIRRGRATPGFRDCLRIRMVQSFVTPPTAGEEEGFQPSSSSPTYSSDSAALGGRDRPPDKPAGTNSSDKELTNEEWLAAADARLDLDLIEKQKRLFEFGNYG